MADVIPGMRSRRRNHGSGARAADGRTTKRSVTIPANVAEEVDARVGPRGFSAYLTRAVVRQLEHDRLTELVAELADEYGEIPQEIAAAVDRQWADALE